MMNAVGRTVLLHELPETLPSLLQQFLSWEKRGTLFLALGGMQDVGAAEGRK